MEEPSDTTPTGTPPDAVLITAELSERAAATPDYEAESRTLRELTAALSGSADDVLDSLAEAAMQLCRAGSAGVSLASEDDGCVYPAAVAGAWKNHGVRVPRDSSPSGVVLERSRAQLFARPELFYGRLAESGLAIAESLFVPFHCEGKAVGTVWVMAHDEQRKFGPEDVRLLTSLSGVAAAAHRMRAAGSAGPDARALHQNDRRLRDVIDALPVAVYVTDAEGRVTHFNDPAVELAGRVPRKGTDRWCISWKLYRADGTPLPHEQCPMALALEQGRAVRDWEAIIVEQPSGRRRIVTPFASPLRDASGRVVGGINMLLDITDRKRSEETQALLAAVVETSDDAIATKTLDGVIRSWNRGAERIFGYTADEAVGRSIDLIIPSELRDEERGILNRLRQGERIHHFETVRVAKGGRRVAVSLAVSPVRDDAGRITGASKVARDITEHKDAVDRLRASEERYRGLAEMLPVAVYTCEAPSGAVTYYNQHAAKLWGRAPRADEPPPRFCGSARLFLPDGTPVPHDQCYMAVALSEGRKFRNEEVVIERPDGSRVTALVGQAVNSVTPSLHVRLIG